MDLLSVTVTGYRRFRAKTSLQTNGKLVALLGPNEAGKSSLLQAIRHLGHGEALSDEEISRDVSPDDTRIVGRFFLEEDELAAARLSAPRIMIVTKSANGRRTFGFHPAAPERDVTERKELVVRLRQLGADEGMMASVQQSHPDLPGELGEIADEMEASGETMRPSLISRLGDALSELEESTSDLEIAAVIDIVGKGRSVAALEAEPTPVDFAFEALKRRVPEFLLFDEEARDLASDYALSALRSAVPPALANLAAVAELDLPALFAAMDANQTARVTTIEGRANRKLAERFREAWRQSGLSVAIRIQGNLLEVQVVDDRSEHTALAERSDGLRQFVALQMFATRHRADRPILLIDEAEQRLHYDAQADLVQMLARQRLAPKVIYTTHSAGCLPEDLGNGVRTVVADHEDGSSRIVNRFWADNGEGFVPLLIGLGASTMAFFPTRHAIMVEGPADMILYPTLFREALERTSLGFQFVPGLSRIAEEQTIPDGAGVLYLVDGDAGGAAIRSRLIEKGVEPGSIFVAADEGGSVMEIEDFISEDRLVQAANSLLARWHAAAAPIDTLPMCDTRMQALEQSFQERAGTKLSKVDLAYALIDLLDEDPTIQLLDPDRIDPLRAIARSVADVFDDRTRR